MKAILLVLLMTVGIAAQESNFHVAGVVAGADGFDFPIAGITAGLDSKQGRFVFSADAAALPYARKSVYNDGHQFDGRVTVRRYVNDAVFVQGGVNAAYLKFNRFEKTTVAPLAGIGFKAGRELFGFNYRHDLTSENKQRVFEGWTQAYAGRHFYFRVGGGVQSFIYEGRRTNGPFFRSDIGFWF